MFRNQYDTDITTFSPQGRLQQIEYATEAVKQGSAVVGLKSNDFVVIAGLKRSPSDLASYQKKLFKIDEHIGIGISGLIADARELSEFMRNECLNYRYAFESNMPVQRLTLKVADKAQYFTQTEDKRPYGVGLLIAGYDKTGPHLFETSPNGNYFDYIAQALGARSQAGKTYLERHFESFAQCDRDTLIKHALMALKATAQAGIDSKSVTVCFVGKNTPFTILDDESVQPFVDAVARDEAEPAAAAAGAGAQMQD